MPNYIPPHFRLDEIIQYDDSTWKTNWIELPPSSGKDHSALNGGTAISINFSAQDKYIRNAKGGIRITRGFITTKGTETVNDAQKEFQIKTQMSLLQITRFGIYLTKLLGEMNKKILNQ